MTIKLGLDIGSNSVGSAWVDEGSGLIKVGVSVFPAGVDESDEKRGEPKNAKRRMTRRTRITLARRAQRKRQLRLKLIKVGLLPSSPEDFKLLLEQTDPWILRRKGLDHPLRPHDFGRALLHLAQRRGALGLKIIEAEEDGAENEKEDGKVKKAIGEVRAKMRQRGARTFGEFIAMIRDERVTPITTEDKRHARRRNGPREFQAAVRNKAGSYEHCADRNMIREEFAALWKAQKQFGGPLCEMLDDDLRRCLDDDSGDSKWRHKGLLFGQRRQSWDLGTLGRCVLEPTERCVPHADMYASHYRVVETVNNLRIIERGKESRSLTPEERRKIIEFLSGPLGMEKPKGKKGDRAPPVERAKTTASVSDLRNLMGTGEQGWGRVSKTSYFRFNIEADEHREINTDWFNREIVHRAVSHENWQAMSQRLRDGINRAILNYDPENEDHPDQLKRAMTTWAGLSEEQAKAVVAAWKNRPRLEAKRLNISRRAVRNLLMVMDRAEPWPDPNRPGQLRWLTQIEARKIIASDESFRDATTGLPLEEHARRRYATGAKGATARDRYYMRKHVLMKEGQPILGPDEKPLAEPPPAPLISNPVVRKAIHEVRRHVVAFMTAFARKPDEIHVELAREAKMGKVDADRMLFRNRLRSRIRNDIIRAFELDSLSPTQQRAAFERVVLCVQQRRVCALCGNQVVPNEITERMAALGDGCEVAHIIPKASGGANGWNNIVLAHTKCNRDMRRQTPRQYWGLTWGENGFDKGIAHVERIYADIQRPKVSEIKDATGDALWPSYFTFRDDLAKIEQFKKEIKDIQEMTPRQEAATKYAARQVMAYLSDGIYDGQGLPERGGGRRIFASDGLWTKRLRDEWGLYFDRHEVRAKDLEEDEKQSRKEKNRGDHRHHAIDAIVIALGSRETQLAWEKREKEADEAGVNTADEEQMQKYRKEHRLDAPPPWGKNREEFRRAVEHALYGDGDVERPVCHRPVKRKLIGALHEETLFGPVLDRRGKLTDNYTAKKSVLQLDPNHLRLPAQEPSKDAIKRLTEQFKAQGIKPREAKQRAEKVVGDPNYRPRTIDAPPGKSGIVRDLALRMRLRQCLADYRYIKKNRSGEPTGESWLVNPDDFTDNEIKQAFEAGVICHASGVPIRSVVLLRTMSEAVVVGRRRPDYLTGKMIPDENTAANRAYVGGNNHHIEIRVDAKGRWSGEVVPAFGAAQRNLARLRALREAGVPRFNEFRKLPASQRRQWQSKIAVIERAHPLVDRSDNDEKGGRFVMSLCEGEMLLMRHKETGEVSYFVVAKLDKPQSIVVVPHWDARAAGERKDADGNKVKDSKREQFSATPSDLKNLSPPGHPHAMKVRVSPLGKVTILERD